MNYQSNTIRDLGLQQLLENGVRLFQQDQMLAPDRRAAVVDGLVQVFSEADRGAIPLRSQSLFSASSSADFERFSIFFRYIKEDDFEGGPLNEISEAKQALESLKAGESLDEKMASRLIRLISLVLTGLSRDRRAAPLRPPVEMKFV